MKNETQSSNSFEYKQKVKDAFATAAEYYGVLYQSETFIKHLLSTRLNLVSKLLGDIDGEVVLDDGCGPGVIAEYLHARNCEYFGLDLSKGMLEYHKRRMGSSEDHVVLGDIEEVPFPNDSFDVVICLGALEYSPDISHAIEEQSRVVRDNGIVIISMQNKRSPYRWWDRHIFRGRILNRLKRLLGFNPQDKLLENNYSREYMCNLLSDYHLKVIDVIYYDFNVWLSPLDKYFPRLSVFTEQVLEILRGTPLKGLGADFIIKAVKM